MRFGVSFGKRVGPFYVSTGNLLSSGRKRRRYSRSRSAARSRPLSPGEAKALGVLAVALAILVIWLFVSGVWNLGETRQAYIRSATPTFAPVPPPTPPTCAQRVMLEFQFFSPEKAQTACTAASGDDQLVSTKYHACVGRIVDTLPLEKQDMAIADQCDGDIAKVIKYGRDD